MSLRLLVVVLSLGFCGHVQAEQASRTWKFDLKTAGTYKIQVKHNLSGLKVPPLGSSKVVYSISIGDETQSRELDLVANQPFVPLITDIAAPQTVRIVIHGLTEPALQHTNVYVFDAATVAPGQYYDPAQNGVREAMRVRALLNTQPEKIDLARVKLTIDKLIDSSVSVESTLQDLDAMIVTIKTLPEFSTSSASKLRALQRYIYERGEWNNQRPFEYDLDDPLGSKTSNKLLSSYLTSRKGNCVTMPLLFVILGQRLGVEVTASTAPKHILVKWKNEVGTWINLEATSGANPARDVWIRQQMPMTDEALANGVYLQPLTKTETAALIASTLAEYYFGQHEYEKAIAIADVTLTYYPKDVGMMVLKGAAFGRLNREQLPGTFPAVALVPRDKIDRVQYLAQNNQRWFAKAEALGWREETLDDKAEYFRNIDQARREQTQH